MLGTKTQSNHKALHTNKLPYLLGITLMLIFTFSSGAAASGSYDLSNAEYIPYSLQASHSANYSVDPLDMSITPLNMSVIRSVLEDQGVSTEDAEAVIEEVEANMGAAPGGKEEKNGNEDGNSSEQKNENSGNGNNSSENNDSVDTQGNGNSDKEVNSNKANGKDKSDDEEKDNNGNSGTDDSDNGNGNNGSGQGKSKGNDK